MIRSHLLILLERGSARLGRVINILVASKLDYEGPKVPFSW